MTSFPSRRFGRDSEPHGDGSPELRVLSNPESEFLGPGACEEAPARLSAVGGRPRLVVAGADAGTRAALREELIWTHPYALILEAGDLWEVLQLAPRATVLILAGDLQDAPVAQLLRLLAHRHPDLDIISLADNPADPATAR